MFATLRLLMVYVLLGAPVGLVGISWSAVRRDFRAMYRWGMGVMALGVRAAGVRIRLEGLENIAPGTQYIFLSNHVSNLDAPVLLPSIPGRTTAFLKREIMRVPLLGMALRMGRFIPVARGSSREEAQQSVEVAAEAMRSGLHVAIFPEGTRSADGRLLQFKRGGFYLAEKTGAPIIPVVIRGTARMMPKDTLKIKAGVAVVRFLPEIRPQEFASREDLMEAVRMAMEAELARS